jgi:hypothetical protein
MGGVVKGITNAAKSVITAPVKLAGGVAKFGIDVVTLPATLTTKALAKVAPSVFGPLDAIVSGTKNLAKGAIDTAGKAATFLPTTALDVSGRTTAAVIQTPFNIVGAATGLKPPY